ncbi:MAG: BREX-1 system adenine-specific DNA-methyltransferase PglX, partial [Paraclostridium sp.]
ITSINKFRLIDGSPIAYWASQNLVNIFEKSTKLVEIAKPRQGMSTGDNERFLKLWFEIEKNKMGIKLNSREDAKNSGYKWFPYNKGGEFRKWYGNNIYLVNWENDGEELQSWARYLNTIKTPMGRLVNKDFYFKKGITWTLISNSTFGARYSEEGNLFDVNGMSLFIKDESIFYMLGFMCSKVCYNLLQIINPTLAFQVGNISALPIVMNEKSLNEINKYVEISVNISKKDWDLFETSWDFKKHPIIEFKSNNIENSFNNWTEFTEKQFNTLKANEEELNKIFIDIYGLQDELTPEVEDKDITIRKADRERDIKSFISYAVGCMLGRYSLDEEGLVFAGGEFDINKYTTFKADEDAIIPITDAEYFEDDIVFKFVEFVKVVFGEESLEENLNYIADTPVFKRKANETSRDTLRRYFLKGFMEDHLKIYQKRPIYWMFDSGKQNGFKSLVYMHRYDESMVAKIRTDYLHTLQRKYESEINRLDNDMNSDMVTAKEKANAKKMKEKIQKQLVECTSYDQVIAHVAHQRIGIDLDDGVKVNYQKFQGVEVPQGDGKKDLKADLLFKVKM